MDHSISGPVLGSPFLGKLPYRLTLLLAETLQSKSPVAFQVEAGFIMIMELLYKARSVWAANSNFSSGTCTQDIMNLTLLGTVLHGGFPGLMYLSMLYPKEKQGNYANSGFLQNWGRARTSFRHASKRDPVSTPVVPDKPDCCHVLLCPLGCFLDATRAHHEAKAIWSVLKMMRPFWL